LVGLLAALIAISSDLWLRSSPPEASRIQKGSGIRYVTPEPRHAGEDGALLAARHRLYQAARAKHPCAGVDTPEIGRPSLPWRSIRNGMASWPLSRLPANTCHWQHVLRRKLSWYVPSPSAQMEGCKSRYCGFQGRIQCQSRSTQRIAFI